MKPVRSAVAFLLCLYFLLASFTSTSARTWYIDPDGTGDAPTIQAGIDSAAVSDTVSLANGIYKGVGNRDIDFGGKAITVRSQSGNPDLCIIDCEDILPSTGFYFRSGEMQTSLLEGIQVTNGNAYPGWPAHPLGTAVECSGTSSPMIRNCSFIGNNVMTMVVNGGVLSCAGTASPHVIECIFQDNIISLGGVDASVIYCTDSCAPLITDCQFLNNTGTSLTCSEPATVTSCLFSGNTERAMLCNGPVAVTGCTFLDNSGGGMFCDGSITIIGCIFEENSAVDGGGIYLTESGEELFASVTIEDCTFLGNSATRGGGVYVTRQIQGIVPSFINCTFIADSAETGGGVYCNDFSGPIFSYCTFSGNSASTDGGGVFCSMQSDATVTNCTFSENSAGGSGAGIYFYKSPTLLEKTIAAFSSAGEGVYLRFPVYNPDRLKCNNIYGNAGGDWVGDIEEHEGISGNFSADPLFCGPIGSGNYLLQSASPCVPLHHPDGVDCGFIGADTVGCISIDVTITSFEIEYENSSVALRWSVSSSEKINGFLIYRSVGRDGEFKKINSCPDLGKEEDGFIDKDISPGELYRYRLGVLTEDGEQLSQILSIEIPPLSLVLHQNYPNPFNPRTIIRFSLPGRKQINLSIYSLDGKLVKTLVDNTLPQGHHETTWDGTNYRGSPAASGIYFYKLKAGKKTLTKKMVLLR